jgi:SulP family sulfate permease
VVSYNMGEWPEIPELLKLSRLEAGTWAATFLLTVFADLTVAVEAGMIMAALVFIRKVTHTTTITQVTDTYVEQGRVHILQDKEIPAYVAIFRIHGPFLFGAADKMNELVQRIPELPSIIIVRLRNMTAIDATGIRALEDLADRVHASGRGLILCGAPPQPAQFMKQAEFEEHVGPENICANVAAALDRARALYPDIAATSPHAMPWDQRETDLPIPAETASAK